MVWYKIAFVRSDVLSLASGEPAARKAASSGPRHVTVFLVSMMLRF